MAAINYTREGHLGVLTFCQPHRGNSIDAMFFENFAQALDEAEDDDHIRVVVSRNEGDNYCVGADAGNLDTYAERSIDQIYESDFKGKIGVAADDDAEIGTGIWARRVFDFKKPLIAAVRGVVAGGGLSIALLHHLRICDETARFTTAFAKLGIGPELGMSLTLPETVGETVALDMLLESRLVEARQAHELGLVSEVFASEAFDDALMAYAHALAGKPPLAMQVVVEGHRARSRGAFTETLKSEWTRQRRLFASNDFKEGVRAFSERRKPVFQGN